MCQGNCNHWWEFEVKRSDIHRNNWMYHGNLGKLESSCKQQGCWSGICVIWKYEGCSVLSDSIVRELSSLDSVQPHVPLSAGCSANYSNCQEIQSTAVARIQWDCELCSLAWSPMAFRPVNFSQHFQCIQWKDSSCASSYAMQLYMLAAVYCAK